MKKIAKTLANEVKWLSTSLKNKKVLFPTGTNQKATGPRQVAQVIRASLPHVQAVGSFSHQGTHMKQPMNA